MFVKGETIQVEKIPVKIGQKISCGASGYVFQGERTDGSVVALKMQRDISEYEKKILQVLKGKKFEHIIQVFAFEEKQNGVFIIMELGEIIDLKNLPDKRKTCLQMAKGVSELHQLGFFHRDIKPNKFVIGKDNKIKLIDFGIAKTITEKMNTQGIGTQQYMAPEVYATQDYDSSIDIWSLGITFYELFTNTTFFEINQQFIRQIIEIRQIQINYQLKQQEKEKKITEWQKQLLQKMIVQRLDNEKKKIDKSIKRISIQEVINELEQLL